LHALAQLRGKNDITFGVWCEIIQPGHIQVGALVIPALSGKPCPWPVTSCRSSSWLRGHSAGR
jgi:hypothetical protein